MESKIFSAQEAREKTDKINEAEEEMVLNKINRAISKGRYKVIISKPLQESTVNNLINNGYTVHQDTYDSDEVIRVIIKW